MNTKLTFFCFWLTALASFAAEFDDYYARGRTGSDAYPDTAIYYIENYKDAYGQRILENAADRKSITGLRINYTVLLGIISTGSHVGLEFEKLKNLVIQFELEALDDKEKMELLIQGYNVLSMSGKPEALTFLMERASFEYWQDHPMPKTITITVGNGQHESPLTAQALALAAIRFHSSPDADAFLRACLTDPRYSENPYFSNLFEAISQLRPGSLRNVQRLRQAWAVRDAANSPPFAPAAGNSLPNLPEEATPASAAPGSNVHETVSETSKPIVSVAPFTHPVSSSSETFSGNFNLYLAAAAIAGVLGLLLLLARRKA